MPLIQVMLVDNDFSTIKNMKSKKNKLKEWKIQKLKKNIRLYYGFRVLCTMNFIMPIFMLFLIDKGLSGFQIMVTQAGYTLVELLLTVPSGAMADKIGRKKTLILSTMLYVVAFVVYGMSDTFVQILLAEIVFAASSATFHGTGEAFLYDTLAEGKQEKKYKNVLGTAFAIQSLVMGSAAVVGGIIAKTDLALPFFISAVPIGLSMIPLFLLDEPKRKKSEQHYWKLMKDSISFLVKHKRMRNIFYYAAFTTVAGFMGWMLYQPLFTEMGMRIEYLGVVMMLMSVMHAVGNKVAERFEQKFGKFDLMLLFAGFRGLLFLLVWLGGGLYIVVWALLMDLVAGMSGPIVSDWINRCSKEENRATILSISSMSGTLAFTLVSPLIGLYMDVYSTQAVYLLLASILGIYACRQVVVLLIARR